MQLNFHLLKQGLSLLIREKSKKHSYIPASENVCSVVHLSVETLTAQFLVCVNAADTFLRVRSLQLQNVGVVTDILDVMLCYVMLLCTYIAPKSDISFRGALHWIIAY